MSKFILAIGGLILIATIVHFVAETKFKNVAKGLMQQVATAPKPKLSRTEIPKLILDYVERAGVKPDQLATTIKLTQIAEMRIDKGGDWQSLTAEQIISTGEIGFVWWAEQAIGPIVKFRVIDAYVNGRGRLNVRIMGSIPVGDISGDDVDIAEAMRYLSELVWAPDAMIGNPQLSWKELTDHSVYLSVILPAGNAGVTFLFDSAGDIVKIIAKDRPAEIVDGKAILRDWQIKIGDYKTLNGRRIPTTGEVGYTYEDGYEAYWRGEVVSYEAKTP